MKTLVYTITIAAIINLTACGGSDDVIADVQQPPTFAASQDTKRRDVFISAAETDAGWQMRVIGVSAADLQEFRLDDGRDVMVVMKAGVDAGHGTIIHDVDGFTYASTRSAAADGLRSGTMRVVQANLVDDVELDIVQLGDGTLDAGQPKKFASAAKQTCRPNLGKLVLPSLNPITKGCKFGQTCGSQTGGQHAGVDFAGPGQVYAIAEGEVVRVIKNGNGDHGLGNVVIIAHRTRCATPMFFYSMSAHLKSLRSDMKPGRIVKAGTLLGSAGGTGAGGVLWDTHLHFEVKTTAPELGNPVGIGNASERLSPCTGLNAAVNTCFGYTRLDPTKYGYLDPMAVLNGASAPNQSIP